MVVEEIPLEVSEQLVVVPDFKVEAELSPPVQVCTVSVCISQLVAPHVKLSRGLSQSSQSYFSMLHKFSKCHVGVMRRSPHLHSAVVAALERSHELREIISLLREIVLVRSFINIKVCIEIVQVTSHSRMQNWLVIPFMRNSLLNFRIILE
ncbi:hypothetical protein CLUG_05582 [Clavispora lusitaniae ATCC 42720]|uniref:Uncharacterized protein n=1 Tax=Clavispora lusitaniae (strain ATCC 42720) TaxID=306902 RepID=C4YBK4_CLAL4|nr:uncharacterized protein CLUG_05582 [Clavispora lusitaniae ATCC 42720]EEQ41453.1 hypothetical protein CLUG_05582 [Clavispora lusitaniae ATCC 42720]